MRGAIHVFGIGVLLYFVSLNLIYIAFTLVARKHLVAYRRSLDSATTDEVFRSPLTPPISVLLPAFNEQAVVVESVRSLLQLQYPEFEVVVIDDGSTDQTLEVLREAFELVPVRKALRTDVPTAPVHAAFVSRRHPELWVISKDNGGGKADALNVGLNAARYPYVCAVDADAVLEENALLRVVAPIIDDPEVVAAGGIVRIANGCVISHGRVVEVGLPRSRLATLQVVEYLRAFLVGRVGWSALGALLIISGAFGLFKRSAVVAAGGYLTSTVGEDVELVVRLHRHMRSSGRRYRIAFVPDPVCWTEAPEELTTLGRQRRRWQRGLAETLWRHRAVFGSRRYGALGLLAFPYFTIYELAGPIVELGGYVVIPLASLLGILSVDYLLAFLAVGVGGGTLLSVSALALEELSFRKHPHWRQLARLVMYSIVDNLGYRQLTNVWRALGLVDHMKRRRGWGVMPRKGLARELAQTRGG